MPESQSGGQCRTPILGPDPRGEAGRNRFFLWLARLLRDLRLVLVEIEAGVKLRLLGEKVLQAGLVLEGAAELREVVGKGLLLALDFPLLLQGLTVKPAQNMLDAGSSFYGCLPSCRFDKRVPVRRWYSARSALAIACLASNTCDLKSSSDVEADALGKSRFRSMKARAASRA